MNEQNSMTYELSVAERTLLDAFDGVDLWEIYEYGVSGQALEYIERLRAHTRYDIDASRWVGTESYRDWRSNSL